MRRLPVLPGHDLSWDMGPKSHTTIIVPSGATRTCIFIRQLLIRELTVPLRGTVLCANSICCRLHGGAARMSGK
ncbi:hypothetical protein AVEN_49526-1, partial [Araneus ventricosus]